MDELQRNYRRVQNEIAAVCTAQGREAARLLVVAKGRPVSAIKELYALGQRDFGENFLPELREKYEELKELDINWVFIGILQSNRIKQIVQVCSEIQSVVSSKHARYIERYAVHYGKTPFPIYLAINIGNELQKQGVKADKAQELARQIEHDFPHLNLAGVMAIPPVIYNDRDWQSLPPAYEKLGELKASCGKGELSLGMSADLRLALQAGSTCVRVGRSIFTPEVVASTI